MVLCWLERNQLVLPRCFGRRMWILCVWCGVGVKSGQPRESQAHFVEHLIPFGMKFDTFSRFFTVVSQLVSLARVHQFSWFTMFFVKSWLIGYNREHQAFLEQVVLLLEHQVKKKIWVTTSKAAILTEFSFLHPDLLALALEFNFTFERSLVSRN